MTAGPRRPGPPRPTSDVAAFYDALADDYTTLFHDWDRAVVRQGEILDALIRAELPPSADADAAVLDAACGIGTQAIGLALRGYRVTATDVSERSVERAGREAQRLGARIELAAADVRELPASVTGAFDVAIAFDNALPHLIDRADLVRAFGSLHRALRPNGLLLASVRDYDRLLADRPTGEAPRMSGDPGSRRAVVQAWDWDDGEPIYRLHQFVLVEAADGAWSTRHLETRYRAYRRDEIAAAAERAGFKRTAWLEPAETGFYQPILRAHRV